MTDAADFDERAAAPHPDREAARLLAWYDSERRDLPWRRRPEPWAIWVSEVMLQQTRVETVVPYFERFLRRFPTPETLAAAPVEEALALWSGLGYYRRCRQLHAGARAIVARGGEIPRRAAELERLPGIGPYTAAAIASIAFGEAVPVLDGNVARVMARRLALAAEGAAARRRLGAAAAALLDPRRPGDSNQALMELGATLCAPTSPRCPACPLAAACRGRASGEPERFPAPRKRPRVVAAVETAALVEGRGGRLLFVRRPHDAQRLAGLWELPTVEAEGELAERELAATLGGSWRLGEERARVGHAITTRKITLTLRAARLTGAGGIAEGREAAWWTPEEARARPLTGASRKLLTRLVPVGD
ncbi:MAG: A/G-specific adenine glycosylase [Holophagales bacterium]|nr:A/G-specific adenine glycosylase [Holophagales bacterium]